MTRLVKYVHVVVILYLRRVCRILRLRFGVHVLLDILLLLTLSKVLSIVLKEERVRSEVGR